VRREPRCVCGSFAVPRGRQNRAAVVDEERIGVRACSHAREFAYARSALMTHPQNAWFVLTRWTVASVAATLVGLGCSGASGGGDTDSGTGGPGADAGMSSSGRGSGTGREGSRDSGARTSGSGSGTGTGGSVCQRAATMLTSCGLSTGGIAADCDAQNTCYAKCMLAATCGELQGSLTATNTYTACLSGCP